MKLGKQKTLASIMILVCMFVFCASAAGDTRSVLVLPFNIHAEKDLSFLQKGIRDMLTTRLAAGDGITIVNSAEALKAFENLAGPVNMQSAISLGEKVSADYVLFGSLMVFGESISTDARFVDVSGRAETVTFSRTGTTHGDVIAHINILAGQVNGKGLSQNPAPAPAAPLPQQNAITLHPDKILAQAGQQPVVLPAGQPAYVPPVVPRVSAVPAVQYTAPAGMPLPATWKSRKFKTRITGLDVGDVDGDGQNEIVFIDHRTVYIYRYVNGTFVKIVEMAGKEHYNYIGIDIADINGNGTEEIFVTHISQSGNTENRKGSWSSRLKSFVLEWNGNEFARIVDSASWFFRVINTPGKGDVLLGQKKGRDEVFDGGVHELAWKGTGYEAVSQLRLPGWMNIYGFTFGDVQNNGTLMLAGFSKKDYLQILNSSWDEEWISEEPYGGTPTHIEYPNEYDSTDAEHYYIPQRVHVADLDRDGRQEVIIVRNIDKAGRLLSRIRSFKNGYIECLSWNSFGLEQKWKTQKISRYITDYVVDDMNNDGLDEVVFSVNSITGGMFKKDKGYIASWQPAG